MAVRNPQQTRDRLIQTAFEQMHAHGYQGMRVDEVLRGSDLRKGAFYHHFDSKTDLAYAVLEERIRPLVESIWLAPLAAIEDPVEQLPKMLDTLGQRVPQSMRDHGCPLNNLAQEMASQDDGFRERIAKLFDHWIAAYADLIERGKSGGHIRPDVDSTMVARYLIATLEGCVGMFKIAYAADQWVACRTQLAAYLLTLRPAGK